MREAGAKNSADAPTVDAALQKAFDRLADAKRELQEVLTSAAKKGG